MAGYETQSTRLRSGTVAMPQKQMSSLLRDTKTGSQLKTCVKLAQFCLSVNMGLGTVKCTVWKLCTACSQLYRFLPRPNLARSPWFMAYWDTSRRAQMLPKSLFWHPNNFYVYTPDRGRFCRLHAIVRYWSREQEQLLPAACASCRIKDVCHICS